MPIRTIAIIPTTNSRVSNQSKPLRSSPGPITPSVRSGLGCQRKDSAIHGTPNPSGVSKSESHGCIRPHQLGRRCAGQKHQKRHTGRVCRAAASGWKDLRRGLISAYVMAPFGVRLGGGGDAGAGENHMISQIAPHTSRLSPAFPGATEMNVTGIIALIVAVLAAFIGVSMMKSSSAACFFPF